MSSVVSMSHISLLKFIQFIINYVKFIIFCMHGNSYMKDINCSNPVYTVKESILTMQFIPLASMMKMVSTH